MICVHRSALFSELLFRSVLQSSYLLHTKCLSVCNVASNTAKVYENNSSITAGKSEIISLGLPLKILDMILSITMGLEKARDSTVVGGIPNLFQTCICP